MVIPRVGFHKDRTGKTHVTEDTDQRVDFSSPSMTRRASLSPSHWSLPDYHFVSYAALNHGLAFSRGRFATTGVAALGCGMRFQGCEIDADTFRQAQQRLAQERKSGRRVTS
jgi:hypothetical protein